MDKILATLGVLVGGLGAVFALLEASGVDITKAQETSIAGIASLLLAVLGAYFHPNIPVGKRA